MVSEEAVKDGASAKYRGNICLRANKADLDRDVGINAALW